MTFFKRRKVLASSNFPTLPGILIKFPILVNFTIVILNPLGFPQDIQTVKHWPDEEEW